MKWCPICNQMKTIEEFYVHRAHKNGRQTYCKPCANKGAIMRHQANKAKIKIIPENKKCTKCKKIKNAKEFSSCSTKLNGLRSTCKKCDSKILKLYRKNNPDKARDQDLRREFGITLLQYRQMLSDQGECCKICHRHQSQFKHSLHVDHNHKTGRVRALLCGPCNHALGLLQENETVVLALAQYIHDHK